MLGVNRLIARAGVTAPPPSTDRRHRCPFCGKVYSSKHQAQNCRDRMPCRVLNFPSPQREREWSIRAGTASLVYMVGEVFKHELQDEETTARGVALQSLVEEVWANIKERHPVGVRVTEHAYGCIEDLARKWWGLGNKQKRVGVVHLLEVVLLLVGDALAHVKGRPEADVWAGIELILESALSVADPDGTGCDDSVFTDDAYEELRRTIWQGATTSQRAPSLYLVNGRFYCAARGRREARAHIKAQSGLVRCVLSGVAPCARLPIPVDGADTAHELIATLEAVPALILLQ